MNRMAIRQSVFDELGIILVDKSEIREEATFEDLVLDDDDIERLFNALGEKFNLAFPDFIKAQTTPLTKVVDMILERAALSDGSSASGSKAQPRHRH